MYFKIWRWRLEDCCAILGIYFLVFVFKFFTFFITIFTFFFYSLLLGALFGWVYQLWLYTDFAAKNHPNTNPFAVRRIALRWSVMQTLINKSARSGEAGSDQTAGITGTSLRGREGCEERSQFERWLTFKMFIWRLSLI